MRLMVRIFASLFVVAAFFGCVTTPQGNVTSIPLSEKTEANIRLDSFPDQIPGIFGVYKFEEPGAKHCLIHVWSMHSKTGISKEGLDLAIQVQGEIYDAISYFAERGIMSKIYKEGELDNEHDYINALRQGVVDLGEVFQVIGATPDGSDFDSIAADEQEQQKQYYDQYDAVYNLGKLGGIEVVYAERSSIKARADLYDWFVIPIATRISSGKNTEEMMPIIEDGYRFIFKYREDALLDIIHESGDVLAVTVYGGAHRWIDNIAKWNRDNPDSKFSLIEVVPGKMKKYITYRKKLPILSFISFRLNSSHIQLNNLKHEQNGE